MKRTSKSKASFSLVERPQRDPRRRTKSTPAAQPGRRALRGGVAGKVLRIEFASFGGLASDQRDHAVRKGLPAGFLDQAARVLGVSKARLFAALAIAPTTAARREQTGTLNVEESDRLARLARLWHDAKAVFEDDEATRQWLTGSVPSLQQERPLDLLLTHEGFERARRVILQLSYGVPA